ncbi:BTAD domain-containing putative transcriptional regulator [Kitasatospora sp. NPDC002965]|uniref:AfsR/SARP family transcriptional regulator n=1 Tax=Kitasatospora sp. NPDC002965 TaxID=3154775 RepID=UPI0033BC58A8
MSVRIRLLGGVEVLIGRRAVDLGHPRQQCVLVALLADRDACVTAEQLLERVWGEAPPRGGRSTLYSYLSRLRQALEGSDEARIERRGGGYAVDVDPMAVDLYRFARWTGEARTAEPSRARLLLEQAVALRRGTLLPRIDTPWLNELRTRLDERHRTAEADLMDLRLDCGEHAEVLADLQRLVTGHPLDEGPAGRFMLALYRSGRQADALEHYERTRRELAEQLGVEPGPELRRLHLRILAADPALEAPRTESAPVAAAPPSAEPGFVVPRQLPLPPDRFTAREAELERLGPRRGEGARPVLAVTGAGGMGKTWLALRWAYDNLDSFPDGQLFVNLKGFDPSEPPIRPQTALRGFLEALGVAPHAVPTDLHGQTGLYRSLTAAKRILVVLDNAHDTEQVLPLLPGGLGCTALVTSRRRLPGLVVAHGAHVLTLGALSGEDSARLFGSHLGHPRPEAERAATDRLLALCGGMPLAIGVLAARAADRPELALSALAEDLGRVRNTLDAFGAGDGDTTADVRAVLTSSYRTFGGPAQRLFRLLGAHPGPDVSLAAAAALVGEPVPDVRPVVAELARAHFLTEDRPGRYTLHDLVRAHALELVAGDADRDGAFDRLVDHYLHTALACDSLLNVHQDTPPLPPPQPGSGPWRPADEQAAHAWFAAEYPVLGTLVQQAGGIRSGTRSGIRPGAPAWQLASTLSTFLGRGARWHDVLAVFEAALDAATAAGDRAEQARAHRELGCATMELGRHDEALAHLEESVRLCRALGRPEAEGHAELHLGYLWEVRGDQERALRHDLLALDLFDTAGDGICRARALNAAGWDYAQLGRYAEAADTCRRALDYHREVGDHRGEANALDSIGFALQGLGRYPEAADCYERALVINRTIGHRSNEAQNLEHLGDAHHAAGHVADARAAWQEAAEVQTDLTHRLDDVARLAAKIRDCVPA